MAEDPLARRFAGLRSAIGQAGHRPPVETVVRGGERRIRRRVRASVAVGFAAVAVLAVAVVVAGRPDRGQTGTVVPPSSAPAETVVGTPSPALSPSLPSLLPPAAGSASPVAQPGQPCATGGLAVSVGDESSAKFRWSAQVRFVNRSGVMCTLSGYPGLAFRHDGAAMEVRLVRSTDRPVTVVELRPGRTAVVLLLWNAYEGQGTTCRPVATAVAVTPPGQNSATTVGWLPGATGGSICGAVMTVYPVEAG